MGNWRLCLWPLLSMRNHRLSAVEERLDSHRHAGGCDVSLEILILVEVHLGFLGPFRQKLGCLVGKLPGHQDAHLA